MNWLTQLIGVGLILLVMIDLFLTVLYPRSGKGWLSVPLSKALWQLCCALTFNPNHKRNRKRDRILPFCGPILLIAIVLVWVLLLLFGFALVVWPALGFEIQASQGSTPTTFQAAVYYSGYCLTTLGMGDLAPKTGLYQLLAFVESAIGFSVFTLTITYLLAVYGALTHRNIFALSLHHSSAKTANAAELIARLGACGNFDNSRQDLSQMATNALTLLESHHAYPVLHYFRFHENYYALSRITLLVMDTVTLMKTALNADKYRSLIRSTAIAELGDGGQHLLVELSDSFLPGSSRDVGEQPEVILRSWYYQAVKRLEQEGIEINPDLEAGVEQYITLRRQWEPYVAAIAKYMAYHWCEVAPAEYCGSKQE